MRIVHVIWLLDPAQGGPPTVVTRLAAAQASAGHDVQIVAQQSPGCEQAIAASVKTIPGFSQVKLTMTPPVRLLLPRDSERKLTEVIGSGQILHAHGLWEPLVAKATRTALKLGVPYMLAPHGMLYPWSLGRKRLKKRIALLLGYRRMVNRAAMLHMLNADEQRAVAPLHLRPPVVLLPNGVSPEEIQSLPPRGTFYQAHPQLQGRPFVLFLSRLHPGKGLHRLGAAFAMIAGKMKELQFVVAGPDAGARAAFESQITAAGLTNRVHLLGPVYGPMKFAALVDAACFCLPSEHETFSMAITEALGCGTPIVITEACHFSEVAAVGAGEVTTLDAGSIAAALERILGDPALQERMGRAGRELVFSRYTWPRVAEQSINAYHEILRSQAPS